MNSTGRRKILAGLGALALLCADMRATGAVTPERLEEDNALKIDVRTPHTKYARPYARGAIRALFLVHQSAEINALPIRHAVELMQRFDIEGDAVLVMTGKGKTYAVAYKGGSGVYGGDLGEQRLDRLLEIPYDCYVVTGPILGHIPPAGRQAIMDRVEGGAGLALLYRTGDEDKPLLAGARELSDLPATLWGLEVRTFSRGEGRIVSCAVEAGWNGFRASGAQMLFGFDLHRDLYYEARGRAILWAADRQPRLDLSLALPAEAIDRGALADHPLSILWKPTSKGPGGPIRIEARIRSAARGEQNLRVLEGLAPEGGRATIDLPSLPAGSYRVQAIASGEKGVEAWTLGPLIVTSRQRIAAVRVDREWGEAGAPIEGTVTIDTAGRDGLELHVAAIDRHGRILARQVVENPAEKVSFSLATDAHMPGYLFLEAALVADGQAVCHGYAGGPYTIPRRRHDQWNYMLWGRLYASLFLELGNDLVADSGVTSRIETSHVPWWHMTRAGLNYTPYCSSGLYRLPDMGPQEPMVGDDLQLNSPDGCWNHEPNASRKLAEHLDAERDFRRHGVLAYSMGDELGVFGSCLRPSCWKVYRQWLQREYGDIEALNDSWGASYGNFDEIEPLIDKTALVHLKMPQKIGWIMTYANNAHSSRGPTHTSQAWQESWRSYPRYIDRRSFQYWNFARYAQRFGDTARRMDPPAICGVEGTDIQLDADIDVIVRHMGWWMPYGGQTVEVIRSVAPEGMKYGNFIGPRSFWFSFLRGANTVGRFRIDSLLTPRMSLYPMDRRMVESARIVFDGVGTLLNVHRDSRMLDDGIVMLHAMTSVKMAKLGHGPTYGNFRTRDHFGRARKEPLQEQRSHRAWHRAIRAAGLQMRYATDGQIRRDAFDAESCKVLILSQYEAIGPDEEALIRRFVQRGGTVLADVRPGIYGARGKQRVAGVLDDLFGVRHGGDAPAVQADGKVSGRIGSSKLALELPGLIVNPALQVTRGRVLGKAGEVPICIERSVGKGRAMLLNFALWSCPNPAVHDGPDGLPRLLDALFAQAGVSWPLELLDADGRRHRNIEAMRWRTGEGIQVVALYGPGDGTAGAGGPPAPFRGLDEPASVTVRLPGPMHVAQMGTGRRIGLTQHFTTGVRPWWATMFAVSARKLQAPVLQPADGVARRGSNFEIALSIPDAQGLHAVKVRVEDPDGSAAPWFDRGVIVENGAARLIVPIAHNERAGSWRLTATDLYTDEAASVRFQIR